MISKNHCQNPTVHCECCSIFKWWPTLPICNINAKIVIVDLVALCFVWFISTFKNMQFVFCSVVFEYIHLFGRFLIVQMVLFLLWMVFYVQQKPQHIHSILILVLKIEMAQMSFFIKWIDIIFHCHKYIYVPTHQW